MSIIRINERNLPIVNSLDIAEAFGRDHNKVIQSIESLIASGHLGGADFGLTSYTDKSNRQSKCYELTEAGFMVACPFIGGEKARDGQVKIVNELQRFRSRAQLTSPSGLLDNEIASRNFKALQSIALLTGLDQNESCLRANIAVRNDYGIDLLEKIGQTHLIAAKQEIVITATDLTIRLGVAKLRGNKLLTEAGFQTEHRDHKNRLYYSVTPLGKGYAKILDTGKVRADGTNVQQIKWRESVIPFLEKIL